MVPGKENDEMSSDKNLSDFTSIKKKNNNVKYPYSPHHLNNGAPRKSTTSNFGSLDFCSKMCLVEKNVWPKIWLKEVSSLPWLPLL